MAEPAGQESGVITRPKFRMWVRPDGIVHAVISKRASIMGEDAVEMTNAMSGLTGGQPRPLLVDTHDIGPLDRSARQEFASRGDLVPAVALIVGTPMSRMLGNFFLAVARPEAPTRLFDDEASALSWLAAFIP